jgi:hypothetical protein
MAYENRKVMFCMNDVSMGSSFDSFTANLIKSFSKFAIELVLTPVSWIFLSEMSGNCLYQYRKTQKKRLL